MCILITKDKGAEFPPIGNILNSAENNPDGFSLAWNEEGRVRTYRTLDRATFIRKYISLANRLGKDSSGMVLHARIATHGAVSLANCHCWTSFAGTPGELAFAHNGILAVPPRGGMTDSETFLRDYFEPSFARAGWRGASGVIARKIGFSKFAFIDKEGNIRRFGQFITEDGCQYSNTSYLRRGFAGFAAPSTMDANEYSHAAQCLDIYLHNTAETYERYTVPFIDVAAGLINDHGLEEAREFIEDCHDFINPAIGDACMLVEKYDGLTPTAKDWQEVERDYIDYVIECAKYKIANA